MMCSLLDRLPSSFHQGRFCDLQDMLKESRNTVPGSYLLLAIKKQMFLNDHMVVKGYFLRVVSISQDL